MTQWQAGLCRLPDPRVAHPSHLCQTGRCIDPFRYLPTSGAVEYSHRACSGSFVIVSSTSWFCSRRRLGISTVPHFLLTCRFRARRQRCDSPLPWRQQRCFRLGISNSLDGGPRLDKDAASMRGRWHQHFLLSVQASSLGDIAFTLNHIIVRRALSITPATDVLVYLLSKI